MTTKPFGMMAQAIAEQALQEARRKPGSSRAGAPAVRITLFDEPPPEKPPQEAVQADAAFAGVPVLAGDQDDRLRAVQAKLRRRNEHIARLVALRTERLDYARNHNEKDPLAVRRFLSRNDRAILMAALNLAANEEDNPHG